MSGNDHLPRHDTAVHGNVLWWRARCRGCDWEGDWTPDRDTVQDQYMDHYMQVSGALPRPSPENCTECHGRGGPECDRCDGRGREACWTCRGDPGEGLLSCTACQGQGFDECTDCDGRGAKRCSTCGKRGPGRRGEEIFVPTAVGGGGCSPVGAIVGLLLVVGVLGALWKMLSK